jgi:hypothetical protein
MQSSQGFATPKLWSGLDPADAAHFELNGASLYVSLAWAQSPKPRHNDRPVDDWLPASMQPRREGTTSISDRILWASARNYTSGPLTPIAGVMTERGLKGFAEARESDRDADCRYQRLEET